MAREGRLHGGLGRLLIPYLSDHYHIGVLSQYGAHAAREGEACLGVYLRLPYQRQLIFLGVFDGDDVQLEGIYRREGGVERRGLPAPRRARHEYDPIRQPDKFFKLPELPVSEAEVFHAQDEAGFIQYPHHYVLAVDGRERRDPQIYLLILHP